MDEGILLHAFLDHAYPGQASALPYQTAKYFSFASTNSDIPAFGALANDCQQPSNFAYIIMAGRPWPSGDSPLLPQWTPINGPRVDRTGAEIRALSYVHDSEENAEAVVAPLAVWNDRQYTPESTLLRNAARWRPADTITPDDTGYILNTAAENQSPATLTDDEIFAGGLELLDNSSYLLQIAGTHRNQEIVDKINAGYTESVISQQRLLYKIKKALDEQARVEDRPRADIKAELQQARKKSGVAQRTLAEREEKSRATRAAKKAKDLEAASMGLEKYGFRRADGFTTGPTSPSNLDEVAEDEDDPLDDLEEMGRRVTRGSLASIADDSLNKQTLGGPKVVKKSQQTSSGNDQTRAPKRKAYDYDRDGDTTDEETRAEQISRFQRRKTDAKKAANEAKVRHILKML